MQDNDTTEPLNGHSAPARAAQSEPQCAPGTASRPGEAEDGSSTSKSAASAQHPSPDSSEPVSKNSERPFEHGDATGKTRTDAPHPQPQARPKAAKQPNRKQTPQSSWRVLGSDLQRWMHGHVFAISVSLLFVLANFTRWIWRASRHIVSNPTVHSLSLSQALKDRHLLPGGSVQANHPDLLTWLNHVLGSVVFVRGLFQLLLYFVLLLVVISSVQTRLGVWKTIATSLFSAILGSTLGLGICMLVSHTITGWSRLQELPVTLSPLVLIVGALMAQSAFESVLWRRRIVLITYTTVGTLLLFSGNPGDYCNLAAAVVGHALGLLMRGKTVDKVSWKRGTDYEIRRLFTFAQLVLAIGPIFSLTSTSRFGLFTSLGLFYSSMVGDSSLLRSCSANQSVQSCIMVSGQHHLELLGLWIHILLPVAALAVVAWGLYHGRRLAAWTSMALNTLVVIFTVLYYVVFPIWFAPLGAGPSKNHAVMPAFILTALPPLLLVMFMARQLEHFEIATPASRIRRGIGTIALILVGTVAGYTAFALSFPDSFKPKPDLKLLVLDMLRRLLPSGFAGRRPSIIKPDTVPATLVSEGFTTLFWLTVLVVFILWFKDNVTPDEHDRAKANLLVQAGGSSMSFMTTWEDNHYWFSQSGHSAIAYRVLHGIALSVTGPFGDEREYRDDLAQFTVFCENRGWSPAFYAVHDDQRTILESMGCSSIQVGTEMVIDPNQWQTRGKKWQDIRTAINKAKRDGITDELCTYDTAGFDIQQQIVEISEQWTQLKALPEMKFTLGGLEELRDERVALLYAKDADGRVLGVTSWLPTYRAGRVVGWTLDFMRHRTDSPNGIMEYLIARMAERLRDQRLANPDGGVEFMSLSAAPLAGMGEGRGTAQSGAQHKADNPHHTSDCGTGDAGTSSNPVPAQSGTEIIEHALQIVADIMEPAYGFKSLFFFKRKFQPRPSPIYVCYPDAAKLAQIGISVVNAYVPELKANQVVDILKTMASTKKTSSNSDHKGRE